MTIITDQDLPTIPGRLLEILTQCAQLQTLEYCLQITPNRPISFPAEINTALTGPLSRLRLHINLWKRQLYFRYDLCIKSIAMASSNLVYLDLTSHGLYRMHQRRLDEVRTLLVRCTRLETLCIIDSGLFENWQAHHGSMPPIKELRVTRWWGIPGRVLATNIWDISKLNTLSSKDEIVSSTHSAFMQSFPPHSITGLRSFEHNPISSNQPQSLTAIDNHKEANKCLVQMIEDNQEIAELLITTYFAPELIPSIALRLGQTLKALRLRSPDFQDPETSLEDVVALRITCSVLAKLEISISFPDRPELAHEDLTHPTFVIIAELSKISSLQRLKLISQSPAYTVDRDPCIQNIIIDIARDNKVGAWLSQLTFLFPHCRKVDSKYESCQVDYAWDLLGNQACKKSREIGYVNTYHGYDQ
ncbi:hypothetical protein IFR05_002377 [Cadophora sp. M221]|nr:hypothetical protein IFR05_002377 [Cadophora sp. M221]